MNDPREPQSPAEESAQVAMAKAITARVNEINQSAITIRSIREQLNALTEHAAGRADQKEIETSAKSIVDAINALEEKLVQPKQKTFQDVINFRNGIASQYMNLQGAVEGDGGPITTGEQQRFADLENQWHDLQGKENAVLSGRRGFQRKNEGKGRGCNSGAFKNSVAEPANKNQPDRSVTGTLRPAGGQVA